MKRKQTWRDKLKKITHRTGFGLLVAVAATPLMLSPLAAADSTDVNFEEPTYNLGDIDGQDGWVKTGDFDVAVDTNNSGSGSFGLQSLRISNAKTTQAFGDQTYSKPVDEPAGETDAEGDGLSGAPEHKFFTSSFDVGSAVPNAEQPGLLMAVSPDRGDGARMSYLRFEDKADGIHVFFNEYKDVSPQGTPVGDIAGCGEEDDFVDSDIATISRSAPHRITSAIEFKDGPHNDVVKIYVDGTLKKTGTSWEDYFRFCEDNQTRTVDSLLFRVAGAPVLENLGNGFLVDNLQLSSSDEAPVIAREPTNKNQCTKDGYKSYTDAAGQAFKNQGLCVSYVNGRTSLGNLPAF
jgi:hypothetical protein